jgi:hypothetical protein
MLNYHSFPKGSVRSLFFMYKSSEDKAAENEMWDRIAKDSDENNTFLEK